jgi:Raf kinase inhibitor-like YbhB/YbcL family protein
MKASDACAMAPTSSSAAAAAAGFRLGSPAFADGSPIPREHTADGRDDSPPLHWHGAPADTRAFVLILDDPDAPPGLWIHWVIFDIPATARELPAGVPRLAQLADGSRQGRCWGVSRFERQGYYGPEPPPGPPHRYHFTLTALDRPLGLGSDATAAEVRAAMAGHVLAETRLTGLYGRPRA